MEVSKKRLVIITLLLAGVDAMKSQESCSPFECAKKGDVAEGRCSAFFDNKYSLAPRSDSEGRTYCNWYTGLWVDPAVETLKAWPGEPCSEEIPCEYGECVNRYCSGKSNGEKCTMHDECQPEFRCYNQKCERQLAAGETGCETEYDCVNSAGCNKGKCVPYFSLPTDAPVENCEGVFIPNILCQNFACYNGTCTEPVKSQNLLPVNCTTDYDCVGVAEGRNETYYSQCQCGFNPTGTGYCSQFPGDSDVTLSMLCLTNWIYGEMSAQCNTVRRFKDYCIKSFWDKPDYDELTIFMYRANYYPKLIHNPACVKDTVTYFYWEEIRRHDNLAFHLSLTLALLTHIFL